MYKNQVQITELSKTITQYINKCVNAISYKT